MKNIITYITEGYRYNNRGDEFYTKEKDIAKELPHYDFSGKVIYCNCDDPSFSKFYKYFKDNFSKLHIKKLIATYYDDDPKKYEYDGKDENIIPIKSGDFRDNGDTMKECDIVVTNPPFSGGLIEDLVFMCNKYGKDYLFIGPNHFILKKNIFTLFKNGDINMGYNEIYSFYGADGNTNKRVPCNWYTSLDVTKQKVTLTKTYNPEEYPKFDNYDAINCPIAKNIPKDYDGNIATSMQFADKINRDQFEIIDTKSPKLNGKSVFKKIIIKLKK